MRVKIKHFVRLTSMTNATVGTLKTDLGILLDGFMFRSIVSSLIVPRTGTWKSKFEHSQGRWKFVNSVRETI